MLKIFVDADGCSVKEEVYRVARRHSLHVCLVANSWMRTPSEMEFILVGDEFDAADNWIVEEIEIDDIVITDDIYLASRCLDKEAKAVGTRGRIFNDENIKDAIATRDLQAQLRECGIITGGPAPFKKKDRSQFLQSLETVIQKVKHKSKKPNS